MAAGDAFAGYYSGLGGGAPAPGTYDPQRRMARLEQTIHGSDVDQLGARDEQMKQIAALRAQAAGLGPASPAELQMRKAAALNAAGGYAMAASAPGVSPALAVRNAALQASDATGRASMDAGLLRAQETQAAQGMLGQQIGAMRAGDMGMYSAALGGQTAAGGQQLSKDQMELQRQQMMLAALGGGIGGVGQAIGAFGAGGRV